MKKWYVRMLNRDDILIADSVFQAESWEGLRYAVYRWAKGGNWGVEGWVRVFVYECSDDCPSDPSQVAALLEESRRNGILVMPECMWEIWVAHDDKNERR